MLMLQLNLHKFFISFGSFFRKIHTNNPTFSLINQTKIIYLKLQFFHKLNFCLKNPQFSAKIQKRFLNNKIYLHKIHIYYIFELLTYIVFIQTYSNFFKKVNYNETLLSSYYYYRILKKIYKHVKCKFCIMMDNCQLISLIFLTKLVRACEIIGYESVFLGERLPFLLNLNCFNLVFRFLNLFYDF